MWLSAAHVYYLIMSTTCIIIHTHTLSLYPFCSWAALRGLGLYTRVKNLKGRRERKSYDIMVYSPSLHNNDIMLYKCLINHFKRLIMFHSLYAYTLYPLPQGLVQLILALPSTLIGILINA